MRRRAVPKVNAVVRSTEGGPVRRRAVPKVNAVVRSMEVAA